MTTATKKNPPDITLVSAGTERVACDGGTDGLGHPRVWYSFDGRESATCGYCGRQFARKKSHD